MDSLRDLYRTLDQLNDEELAEVRAYIDRRSVKPEIADEDVQAKIAALRAAVDDFWEGIPQEEIDQIIEDANAEYVEPLSNDDWIDERDDR